MNDFIDLDLNWIDEIESAAPDSSVTAKLVSVIRRLQRGDDLPSQLTNHRAVLREYPAILEPVQVLDQGFARLVDWIGGDRRVVEAARVSYGGGTRTLREDRGLIHYLMRNAHTSPFEQVSLVFHFKLPLFVFAQLVRHRTAKLNSLSARFSVMEEEFYLPEAEQLRAQSERNKQVGEGAVESAESAHAIIAGVASRDYAAYQALLEMGVAREQGRMVLPQNLYTQIYWKCDLHNLFHFLGLRLDWHAQSEIRVYAEAIASRVKLVAPLSYEAFEEYHPKRGGRLFSATEMLALRAMLDGEPFDFENPRAQAEFLQKLGR